MMCYECGGGGGGPQLDCFANYKTLVACLKP